MICRIVKKRIPKNIIKKYGWNPTYYEVRYGKHGVVAFADSKKDAIKWKKRFERYVKKKQTKK